MSQFLTNLVIGAGIGCIYGLVGLSFMGIYNATGVLNFAQGDFLMLGAVIPSLLVTAYQLPLLLVALVGVAAAIISSFVLQYVVIEPLIGSRAGIIGMAIATFAFSLVLEGIVGGTSTFGPVQAIEYVGASPIRIGNVLVPRQYAVIILVTVVLTILYWLFLHKTFQGIALRAVGSSTKGALSVGLREKRIRSLAFAISAAIAAGAGFLVAPLVGAGVTMGFPLLLNGFVAAVMGGMGRPFAPLLGGVIVGELVSLVAAYGFPAYADLVTLGLVVIVLFIRPDGLLGTVGHGVIES
jgi:branched-chain amino acid transport system permease protein